MAGYSLYSLDTYKFQRLIEHPTSDELEVLAGLLVDRFQQLRRDFESGEPLLQVNAHVESRIQFISQLHYLRERSRYPHLSSIRIRCNVFRVQGFPKLEY